MVITAVTEDTASCHRTYGLILGLHCGECLQVFMDGKWIQTRMEMDAAQNWYLVGTPYCGDLEYIRARI